PLPPGCVRPKGWGSNTQINAPQQNTKTKGKAGANDIKFQAAKPTLDPGLPGTEWGPNSTKIDANHIRITSPKTGTQYDLATTRTIEVPGPEMHDKPLLELGK